MIVNLLITSEGSPSLFLKINQRITSVRWRWRNLRLWKRRLFVARDSCYKRKRWKAERNDNKSWKV